MPERLSAWLNGETGAGVSLDGMEARFRGIDQIDRNTHLAIGVKGLLDCDPSHVSARASVPLA